MKALLLVCFSVSALAAPVDKILGAREHVITEKEVKSLGERPDRILIGVASDGKSSRLKRARAIIALSHVPTQEALAFLRAVIDDKRQATVGADVLDLAAALGSLAPFGPEVLSDLLPFVTHQSADVRQTVMLALGATRAPEAESALRARLYVERDRGVRDAATRALQKFAR